jgi:hypothetical protein
MTQDKKTHEQTIEEHVASNIMGAIDQAHEYTDPWWTAKNAFHQNTVDSCLEDGYTLEEAGDASYMFLSEYDKRIGR